MTLPTTATIDDVRPRPASRRTVATILTWGHLAWLWVAWVAFGVGLLAILAFQVVRGGAFDQSVWEQIGFGIHRWVIFAAGVTTVPVFAPLIVSSGVTRRRLSDASMAAMVLLAVAATGVVFAGYLVERVVYGSADWLHALDDGTAVFAADTLVRSAVTALLTFSAHYVSGWIIGACFYRFGSGVGIALIVPGLVPIAIVDTLLGGPTNLVGVIDALQDRVDSWAEPVFVLAAAGSLAAVIVACAIARRITIETPIKN